MPITVRQEWKPGFVFANLRRAARKELQTLAPEVEQWARELCPVDTGRLRSTVDAEVARQAVRITISAGGIATDGLDVDYAEYVHDGTNRMAARPFITWTMEDWAPEFRRAVERAWKSIG